jgi:hypothetical protein
MPKWVKVLPSQRPDTLVEAKDVQLTNAANTTNKISFSAQAKKTTHVTINSIYFPGWQVLVDNRIVSIDYSNPRGLITFVLPQGNHTVRVQFVETPIRLVSDIVSVVSLIMLLILCIYSPFRRGVLYKK